MALNFLAFTQKRALGKSVAFEEVIKPKTPKLALKVSAFGVKDIIPTKVTPFAKTTTPAVPTIKPKPFLLLNHFTVPLSISILLLLPNYMKQPLFNPQA